MDNHPIPQDVTHFQFKLIGDMTIKQFAYVASGVIFAWIFLASPIFFIIKLLLSATCVLTGVILAFLPIDGRPSDLMLLNFIKALFNPTQFVYSKHEKLKETIFSSQHSIPTVVPRAPIITSSPPPPKISPSPQNPNEEKLQEQEKILSQELTQAKTEEKVTIGTPAGREAHEKVMELSQELQKVLSEKQELEKQLVNLQKSLAQKTEQVFTPSNAPTASPITQHVRKIPKQMGASIGAPLVPDVPNLITGIIKDPRGNVLSNILIEVKDKDGNPVRAFKTNQLGQFASATTLQNGIYTISFEDPQQNHTFDAVEITANGEIISPLEIISIDAREKLRQELFGHG